MDGDGCNNNTKPGCTENLIPRRIGAAIVVIVFNIGHDGG